MHWRIMTLMLCTVTLTSCGIFHPNPKPCDCVQAQADLTQYTKDYLTCLEDLGNMRRKQP